MENGEVVEEIATYNLATNELNITIPFHGDRETSTVIIGETSTVTIVGQTCQVSDTPPYLLDVLNGAENSAGSDETIELSENDLEKTYRVDIDEGNLSETEIENLPKNIQDSCMGKQIRRIQRSTNLTKALYDQNFIDKADIQPANSAASIPNQGPNGICTTTTTTPSPQCQNTRVGENIDFNVCEIF